MNLNKIIIKHLLNKKPKDNIDLINLVRKKAGEFKKSPVPKASLLKTYREMVKRNEIKPEKYLELLLVKRAIRTLSGVAPITIMTAPMGCPHKCIYCPTEENMPKSYLSNQPAAMRAVLSHFNPYRQMVNRMRALRDNGHTVNKIEIIINGGTWSAHPYKYQVWFITQIYKAANEYNDEMVINKHDITLGDTKEKVKKSLDEYKAKAEKEIWDVDILELKNNLDKEQLINTTTDNRIIGITLETRQDFINLEEIKRLREFGTTKVEIGVQNIYDEVLSLNRRGHDNQTTITATQMLKNAGFKVAYHIMPGMYGSSMIKDEKMFDELFSDPKYKPDFLKIYPCVVTNNSELYELFQQKKYSPYTENELIDLMINIKQKLPIYTRLVRLFRDIPSQSISAGNKTTNLREIIQREMKKKGLECKCIRCREPRERKSDIKETVYNCLSIPTKGGQEYFLSYNSPCNKYIYAFLRLRLNNAKNFINEKDKTIVDMLPDLKNAAIIREVHTYGKLVPVSEKSADACQHIGFGKKLMKKAEELAQKNNFTKMAVIAGIGVRKYYEKLGYNLGDTYMIKDLVK